MQKVVGAPTLFFLSFFHLLFVGYEKDSDSVGKSTLRNFLLLAALRLWVCCTDMERPTVPPPIGNADRSGGLLATSILALSSVLIIIALRFVTRIWLVKRVGWDDWCIVFAGVSLLLRERTDRRLLSNFSLVISSAWA